MQSLLNDSLHSKFILSCGMFCRLLTLILCCCSIAFSAFSAEKDTLLTRIEKIKDPKEQTKLLNNACEKSWQTGAYSKGILYANAGLKIAREHHLKKMEALLLNNIGIIHDYEGHYPEALKNYFDALKIQEKIKDKQGEAYTLSNIGLIYSIQNNNDEALIFHQRSLSIRKQINYQPGIAASYNNIGICYLNDKDFSKALFYFSRSRDMDTEMNDSIGLMDDLNNIALCYMKTGRIDEALETFDKCLKLRIHFNDQFGVSKAYNNIGTCYSILKEYDKAEEAFIKGLQIGQRIGGKESIWYAYENLSEIYEAKKDYKKAFAYMQLALKEKEEWNSASSIRKETETKLNYQFEKKNEQERLRQIKKDIEDQERRKQSFMMLCGLGIILLIVGIFSLFLYRRWKEASEQRRIIDLQRNVVQEKNNEILDSINYAQRIQTAILPSEETLAKELRNYALMFQPKDIVAGDFYWVQAKGDTVFFAVADCTGHGVPGAFMSLLCHNALNRSIVEYNCKDPGKILNQTRDIIVTEFAKSQMNLHDGMDISLCVWDKTNGSVSWAGANNPLWLIQANDSNLIELKGDKQPVGNHHLFREFTTHQIKVESGTRLFLFSDGIPDQFGEESGKKFKTRRLRELILETRHMTVEAQKHAIQENFNQWKGNVDQIDDVCLLIVEF